MAGNVVLLSGGLNSLVLAHHVRLKYPAEYLTCVGVLYGQRHERELDAARNVMRSIPHAEYIQVSLAPLVKYLSGSAVTDLRVAFPKYHEDQKRVVVPNRNALLILTAFTVAHDRAAARVWFGSDSGDAATYADCRDVFFTSLEHALGIGTGNYLTAPSIAAPFSKLNKGEVLQLGRRLGAPLEQTWSCYVGGDRHCGQCTACVRRHEAFSYAGLTDLTTYENGAWVRQDTEPEPIHGS